MLSCKQPVVRILKSEERRIVNQIPTSSDLPMLGKYLKYPLLSASFLNLEFSKNTIDRKTCASE
jgi:hypothetical protein